MDRQERDDQRRKRVEARRSMVETQKKTQPQTTKKASRGCGCTRK